MANKNIISETPITLPEVKELLLGISKRRPELDYVQKKVLANAEKTAKLSLADAKKLHQELVSMGIENEKAVELVNIMPNNKDELRALFAKERKQPESDTLDKILEIMSSYKRL